MTYRFYSVGSHPLRKGRCFSIFHSSKLACGMRIVIWGPCSCNIQTQVAFQSTSHIQLVRGDPLPTVMDPLLEQLRGDLICFHSELHHTPNHEFGRRFFLLAWNSLVDSRGHVIRAALLRRKGWPNFRCASSNNAVRISLF